MLLWLLLTAVGSVAALTAIGALEVRRYSGGHVVAQLALRRRGLYFSRTPDGAWWRLRLRPCTHGCEDRAGWGEPPLDGGVREPRRPLGPGPIAAAVELSPSQEQC